MRVPLESMFSNATGGFASQRLRAGHDHSAAAPASETEPPAADAADDPLAALREKLAGLSHAIEGLRNSVLGDGPIAPDVEPGPG